MQARQRQPQSCTSPRHLHGAGAAGSHTFSVVATVNKVKDPLPATGTWTVDSTPPSDPGQLHRGQRTSPFCVALNWTAATDNTGVTGYDIVPRRRDPRHESRRHGDHVHGHARCGSTTHQYAVRARDIAGNCPWLAGTIRSPHHRRRCPCLPTVSSAGDLSQWTSSGRVSRSRTASCTAEPRPCKATRPERCDVRKGQDLPGATYADAYVTGVVQRRSPSPTRSTCSDSATPGNSLGYVYVDATDRSPSTTTRRHEHVERAPSRRRAGTRSSCTWAIDGAGRTSKWGSGSTTCRSPTCRSTGPSTWARRRWAVLQIGEVQNGTRVYDVAFDDAAFGTSRLGPVADCEPSTPGGVTAQATSAFATQVELDGLHRGRRRAAVVRGVPRRGGCRHRARHPDRLHRHNRAGVDDLRLQGPGLGPRGQRLAAERRGVGDDAGRSAARLRRRVSSRAAWRPGRRARVSSPRRQWCTAAAPPSRGSPTAGRRTRRSSSPRPTPTRTDGWRSTSPARAPR